MYFFSSLGSVLKVIWVISGEPAWVAWQTRNKDRRTMHPHLSLDIIILLGDDKEPVGGVSRMAAEAPVYSELEVIDDRGFVTLAPVVSRDRPGGGLVAPTE